jgi:arylsulfatase A-like enzyme
VVALSSCALLLASALPSRAAETKPRNVVFILVDDLRFDALGFLTKGLETPNLDFLAKNGAYFPNAVVNSSLCSPSRATILTGMNVRNHGVVDNNQSSEAGLNFFPKYLQQAGYQTGFFGKWHMGSADTPRPGFDRWVSFAGQGNYFPTDHLSPEQIAKGQRNMLNVDGQEVPQKNYITDELTDYAMDWLQHRRDPKKPFFLYLSHKAVHVYPSPPPRYAHQYDKLEIELPASSANTEENYRGKPMWVRNTRNSWHGIDFPYHTNQDFREYVRDYYRTLSPVDESLGRILAYLRDNGLTENTVIIFTSDNGFLIGDHGLIDKRNAYEPSIHVPMLMYGPGLVAPHQVLKPMVRNLDIAPTILDIAHVAPPQQFEGRSFLPLATGTSAAGTWPSQDFVYEYYWEWNFPETPTTFAIERDGVKYIQYHGIWDIEELYDLNKDPTEMRNLIDDPAYLANKVELRTALYKGLTNNQGKHMIPYTARYSEGQVFRSASDGLKAADFPAKWLRPPNSPDRDNDFLPDTPEKKKADDAHRAVQPWLLDWPDNPKGPAYPAD